MTIARMSAAAASMAVAAVVFATPAAACRTSGASGVKGAVVDSTMSVQSGRTCMIRHFTTMSDPIGARRFPTTNITVTSKPRNGSVSIEGSRVTYKASATGSDQFTYRTVTNKGAAYDYRVLVSVY